MRRRFTPLAVPILSALFLAQALAGSLRTSLTYDEPIYIAAGASYLRLRDFRMNVESPPLMKQLEAALPLLLLPVRLPPTDDAVWKEARHFAYADRFVAENSERLVALAFWARLPVLLLGTALLLAMAWWGTKLYGPLPALVGLAVAAFSPDLIAHAGIAAQDLGCSAFMLASVASFWHALRAQRRRAWLACGALTGLALLTKFTALLLGPSLLILGVLQLLRGRIGVRPLLVGYAWIAGAVLVLVGAAYGLSFDYALYVRGIASFATYMEPNYRPYLLGKVGDGSFWYYHFVAFVLKEPLPVLLLLGIAGYRALRGPRNTEAAIFLLVPACVMFLASCFDRVNLGIRHVLPALPFLYLFTAQALAGCFGQRALRWSVLALLLWTALESARIFPHHLSYVNQLAGGFERGPYVLDDSNIDWGQDLPALARWQRAHPEARPLKLAYFGSVPPRLYGVEAETMSARDIVRPAPGTYAVSAHQLVWFRKNLSRLGPDADWLTKYRPVARAGYSIYLYRF